MRRADAFGDACPVLSDDEIGAMSEKRVCRSTERLDTNIVELRRGEESQCLSEAI